MTSVKKSRKLPGLWCWLPVVAVVAALFAQPTSNGQAALGSLTVTPGAGQYGGTDARWDATGLPANARAHLQRRGNTTGAWADVEGSFNIGTTSARGSLTFHFPTPAMNSVYFRVVAGRGATEAHHFTSKHQDADFKVIEHNPNEVPLPQTLAIGTAVVDEPFSLEINTVKGVGSETKPALPGRGVILQRRNSDSSWTSVGNGELGRDGLLRFGPYDGTPGNLQTPGDYRVRLEHYNTGGDDIGWFLSLPFELRVVTRPRPVAALAANPTSSSVILTWRLPSDNRRDKIEIYRTSGADADPPSAAFPWQKITPDGFAGTRTSYTDAGLTGNRTYKYAVYTVSADGVYTRVPSRIIANTPAERG